MLHVMAQNYLPTSIRFIYRLVISKLSRHKKLLTGPAWEKSHDVHRFAGGENDQLRADDIFDEEEKLDLADVDPGTVIFKKRNLFAKFLFGFAVLFYDHKYFIFILFL